MSTESYTGPRCRHCGIPTRVEAGGNSFEVRYNETCCLPCAGIKTPQQAREDILREAREYWSS